MAKKTLSETNLYLKDSRKRRAGLQRFIISSSAIEGIRGDVPEDKAAAKKAKPIVRSAATAKQPR